MLKILTITFLLGFVWAASAYASDTPKADTATGGSAVASADTGSNAGTTAETLGERQGRQENYRKDRDLSREEYLENQATREDPVRQQQERKAAADAAERQQLQDDLRNAETPAEREAARQALREEARQDTMSERQERQAERALDRQKRMDAIEADSPQNRLQRQQQRNDAAKVRPSTSNNASGAAAPAN